MVTGKASVVGRFVHALQEAGNPLGVSAVALANAIGIGGLVARSQGVEDRGLHLARCLRDRLLLEAASEISQSLDAQGIQHCFARGVALLREEYELGEREMADIDLYLPAADVSPARTTLNALGYRELPLREQAGPVALRSQLDLERSGPSSEVETVAVDLHWGVVPVDYLLPRPGHPLPEGFWEGIDDTGPLPRPAPEHHVALVVHHLVHHDLMHLRGVLDLALLLDRHPVVDGTGIERAAERWHVLRALRLLHAAIVSNLGVGAVPGIGPPPRDWRARRLANRLRLTNWIAWAMSGGGDEHTTMNTRRIACRSLLLDRTRDTLGLLRDAVMPPREHLRWRWPAEPTTFSAWRRHVGQVVRKVGEGWGRLGKDGEGQGRARLGS